MFLHKNSQKRIYFEDAIYFVTICIQDRFPFFKEDIFCELLIKELKLCKILKGFYLYGFVIIPDHIHLLIQPGDKYNISEIIRSLKTNYSRNINNIIKTSEGAVTSPRLRDEESKFQRQESRLRDGGYNHFAEIIKNHDNELGQIKNQFTKKYGHNQFQFPKFQWQKSFFDHYIRGGNDFFNHLEYIWRNPENHGIINNFEKYRYSSYNGYDDLIDYFD